MTNSTFSRRLSFVKYIYEQGIEQLSKKSSISTALAILNFHDALEQFLMIVADELRFKFPQSIMGYWEEASKKEKSLPYKNDMSKLNKIRVSFKHYGILPNPDDCRDIQYKLHDFFVIVSKDILSVDYILISIADLIEYKDIKEHIKKAEGYLEQEKFEDSIVESAKAFGLFEKRTEGDVWHSFILKERSSSYLDFDIHKFKDESLRKMFMEVKERLEKITKYLNVVFLGIDTYRYQKFKLLTPVINITLGGRIYVHRTVGAFKSTYNLNAENAHFCINFVIDTVLKFQESSFGLFNRNNPHTIKTKNPGTKLYSYKEGIFKEIASVDKDNLFENAKLTLVLEQRKDYWRVSYNEKEAYIKMDDIEWIGETKRPFLFNKK